MENRLEEIIFNTIQSLQQGVTEAQVNEVINNCIELNLHDEATGAAIGLEMYNSVEYNCKVGKSYV